MRTLTTTLFICLTLFGASAIAGPGHEGGHSHGPVTDTVAADKALKKVEQLVKSGKIDASWSGIKPASIEQKIYANGPEWVITFKNDKVSDVSKQALYLFFKLDGSYIAANHTGK